MLAKSELATGLKRRLKRHMRAALWFSLAFNILLLVQPLYMLQVYDRILTSGSYETLLLLSLLALALLVVFGFADAGRRRVFGLIGQEIGDALESPVFSAGMRAKSSGGRLETAVTDMGRVQNLFSAGTIQPFFDAPFVPMFVLLVFFIHPLLGAITLVGAVLLVILAVIAERAAKPLVESAGSRDRSASRFIAGIARQYSAIMSMGMNRSVHRRWRGLRDAGTNEGLEAGRVANRYGAISRSGRQALQVVMLGTAAYLVLRHQISAGAIIAASILSGRALAPIDQTIGGWKPLMQARRSFKGLEEFLDRFQPPAEAASLPRPEGRLSLEELEVAPPGSERAILPKLDLEVEPGSLLLVVGPSGRGKTTLLQTLCGVWEPKDGTVRLGGIDMHGWDPADRGRYVGYLPQHVELLPGTVRENIQRFHDDQPEGVFAATGALGFHEMILGLPEGYETTHSERLSAGQRQMIGLSRAIYGDPILLLLDEPNAHLDTESTARLMAFLREWKTSGRVAVMASHDLRMLGIADQVLKVGEKEARLVSRDAFFKSISENGQGGTIRKVAS